jgi:ubiquinone/menaquinone biosynthesis C-methylase UbiE
VDFSPAMVELARRSYPGLEFREGDAESLPFPDGVFEAVTMNFGLLHLGRPDAALREAARVLTSGGRCAFTVWAAPEVSLGFGIVLRAIETHGRTDVPLPPGPPFFRFSDPQESAAALLAAGFSEPRTVTLSLAWRLSSSQAVLDAFLQGAVRTAALLRAQTPEALDAIARDIRGHVEAYRRGETIELPMAAVLVSASKG